jgi:hypothetical protein
MGLFKKKTDLPSPPKPFGNKEAGNFEKLMPEIPPAPTEMGQVPPPPQQSPAKPSTLPPTPPKFPSLQDELSPTPELSVPQNQGSLSVDKLFGEQPGESDKNPPIDELGFELPDFDENDIRALDEMKSLAPEQQAAPKPEPAPAEVAPQPLPPPKTDIVPQPEPVLQPQKPQQPELPAEPEALPEPESLTELPSADDLDIDFTQELPPKPEQPETKPAPEPEIEMLPEKPSMQEDTKDYWAALSGQPELQPAIEPEPQPKPVMQPKPAPREISYPEYQGPSQVPERKFMEVASYAVMKDQLDSVSELIDSAGEAAMRNATLGKLKTDKDQALVAELNSIQEHIILIDTKLFETPNQFIEVKR